MQRSAGPAGAVEGLPQKACGVGVTLSETEVAAGYRQPTGDYATASGEIVFDQGTTARLTFDGQRAGLTGNVQ